jgi:ubiquinone/menaquinone biosynthesis C-methylase UbiE
MDALRGFFYRYGWDTRCRNLCPARLLHAALPASMRRAGLALLDVGSGELGVSAFLRDVLVVGSDLAPPSGRNGRGRFVRSTATALPFRDRAFPAVSCIDVLEHLAPPQRLDAIRECVRVAAHAVVFAFPEGREARRCDEAFQRACVRCARPVPEWVAEHLRHEFPTAPALA